MAPGKERVIAESPDRLATPSQPALVGAACLIAVVIVVVVQLLHLGQLMDAEQPITAGHAEGLVLAYALATVTIVVAAAALPLRLLWIPVASAALVTLTALAATLILGGELWSFVWALLTMGACWRAGSWLLGVAGASSLAREAAVAWLAGIGVLGISILLIGRAGLVAWWTVGAPILVLGVLGFTGMARSLGREGAHAAWSALTATRLTAGSAGLCLLISALAAVWVAAPELMFDALYHKSWLPGEWARTGEISPSTLHPVFNYSGLSQFIAVPGHLAGAEGVGRYLQWLAHGMLIATVWWAARRSPWAPVVAAALALTPLLFWEQTTAYEDTILALGGAALALAVVSALREPGGSPLVVGFVLGGLAGVCIDLKIHLAPLAAGLLVGWLLMRGRGGWRLAILGVALGGLAVSAPPLVIRWIDTGNPVLPSYNNVFKSPHWPPINTSFGYPLLADPGPLGPISALWTSVAETDRIVGWLPVGALGLLSFAVAIALLTGWRRVDDARAVPALWIGLALGTAVWYLRFRDPRFMLAVAAVAVLMIALSSGTRLPGRRLQVMALSGLGALAVLLWPSAVAQFWNVPGKGIPWKVAIGRMDDREYERQSTPDRDLVALFDRETPPGTLAASGPHERAWLTDGRDLTPFWELDFRLQIDGPPPEQPAETLTAVRAAGVSWVLALTEDPQLANLPYLREMVEAYGVPVGSTPHGTLYRLPAEPPGDVE